MAEHPSHAGHNKTDVESCVFRAVRAVTKQRGLAVSTRLGTAIRRMGWREMAASLRVREPGSRRRRHRAGP
jgi:hypothetical protein